MSKRLEDLKNALNKPKNIEEILYEQSDVALREHKRPSSDLFISALSAGLELGFSVLLIGTLVTIFGSDIPNKFIRLIYAAAYPLGFIFVVLGKSELFTEHTTLAVIPVLNKRASWDSLGRIWLIIYAGNMVGAMIFGYILNLLPMRMGIIDPNVLTNLAEKFISYQWNLILGSGILAGWLMGLLSWLVTSSQDTISRIFIITLITSVIGISGLHHCIVGSTEVFSGMLLSSNISLTDFIVSIGWTTLGNIIGGAFFVALIKYSHVNTHKAIEDNNFQKNKKTL